MLNFIVLGLIPGTHIQITFSWVLLSVAIVLVYTEFRYRRYHHQLAPAMLGLEQPAAQEQAAVPQQTALALRIPKCYRLDLVVWGRQYTLSVEL